MSDTRDGKGLSNLKTLYIVGAAIALIAICGNLEGHDSESRAYITYAVLYLLWGGLICATAHVAFRKGREVVEGAVLGTFGPLGFIIEVLLPPIRDK